MENTSKMYIEHIVIGIQTTLWIFWVFICIDDSFALVLMEASSVIELIVVIPISYALGIMIDRLCKYLPFWNEESEKKIKQRLCKKIINNCGTNVCESCKLNIKSREVWKKYQELEYYEDAMSRKRILRATCFNSFCAAIVGIVMLIISIYVKLFLNLRVLITLSTSMFVISIVCWFTYKGFLKEYYKKQKEYIKQINTENNQEENL